MTAKKTKAKQRVIRVNVYECQGWYWETVTKLDFTEIWHHRRRATRAAAERCARRWVTKYMAPDFEVRFVK